MTDGDREIFERLTRSEASVKSAHKRLDVVERLTQSVSDMVSEIRHMREDISLVQSEVNEMKHRPGKMWDKFIGAVIGAVGTALTAGVISYMIQGGV